MTLLSSSGEPVRNPYEILGLERGAADDEISKAFKKLIIKLHPDKQPFGQSEVETAKVTQHFHNVMEAKSFLLDSVYMTLRKAYDSKLSALESQRHQEYCAVGTENMRVKMATRRSSTPLRESTTRKDYKNSNRRASFVDARSYDIYKQSAEKGRRSSYDCRETKEDFDRENEINDVGSNLLSSRMSDKIKRTFYEKKQRHLHDTESPTSSPFHKYTGTYSEMSNTYDKEYVFVDNFRFCFKDKNDQESHFESGCLPSSRTKSNVRGKPQSPHPAKPHQSAKLSSFKAPPPPPFNRDIYVASHDDKQQVNDLIDLMTAQFICPLTNKLMKDPMMDLEENNYERVAILKYLETNTTSPVTGHPLYVCQLTPNKLLKEKIRYAMQINTGLHPSAAKPNGIIDSKVQSNYVGSTESSKSLRESINGFIKELNSGAPIVSMANLDCDGGTSFSYLDLKFRLEVSETNLFILQIVFNQNKKAAGISAKIAEWNKLLQEVGLNGRLTFRGIGEKFVFTMKKEMSAESFKPRSFRRCIEHFLEMSVRLHNIISADDQKTISKVRLSIQQ